MAPNTGRRVSRQKQHAPKGWIHFRNGLPLAIIIVALSLYVLKGGRKLAYVASPYRPILPTPTSSLTLDNASVSLYHSQPAAACTYRNICLQRLGPVTNILLASLTETNSSIQAEVSAMLRRCPLPHGEQVRYGLYADDGEAVWHDANGLTFLTASSEKEHHPAGWGRAMASLVTALHMWPQPIFSQAAQMTAVYLVKKAYPLSGFEELWLKTALETGAEFSAPFGTVSISTSFNGVGDEKLHCFPAAFSSREQSSYFAFKNEGFHFRQHAHRVLGVPNILQRPCASKDVRIVVLRRNRRVWNEVDVLSMLRRHGFHYDLVQLSEFVPAATQAAIFYKADVVISIHGSQLANLPYMRKGSIIFELEPYHFFHDQVQHFGRMMELDFQPIHAKQLPPRAAVAALEPQYLSLYDTMVNLSAQYTTLEQCFHERECRGISRTLGTFTDVEELEERLLTAVRRLVKPSVLGWGKCRTLRDAVR